MIELPEWATCVGDDNRPVPVPVWMVKNIQNYLNICNVRTPCYAAELDDRKEDLKRLLALVTGEQNES